MSDGKAQSPQHPKTRTLKLIAAELMLWWVQAYFEDEPPFNN